MRTTKSVINFEERSCVARNGGETYCNFHAFTQGGHISRGQNYDRQNIRMPIDGRCGERLRYVSAGKIRKKHRPAEPLVYENEPESHPTPCAWRVKARKGVNSGKITITICDLRHTCPGVIEACRGAVSHSKFLRKILCGKTGINLRIQVKHLQEELRVVYGRNGSYHQVWRAQEHCRNWIQGSNSASFHFLPGLATAIEKADPEAVVDWGVWRESGIFSRMFVCPGATRRILGHCQRVVALDACHSKNKKFQCQIFLTSVHDGNKEAVILCYAIAHTEDTDTWTWFCQKLKESIASIDGENTVIISDRDKGLAAAVDEVFPDLLHGTCYNHLLMNCQKHFGKSLAQGLSKICYARTPESFDELLRTLERSSEKGEEMANYLRQADPWRWARCLFSLPRFGRTTSNIAESLNAALLPIREGAAFTIIVDLWYYVQQQFTMRREKLPYFIGTFTPYAEERFRHNERHAESLICLRSDDTEASVKAHRGTNSFLVKRHPRIRGECTCAEYQEMLWPCRHGIAFERDLGKMAEDRVDVLWHISSLCNIYERNVIPSLELTDLEPELSCKSPPEALLRGRQRTVPIPNNGFSSTTRGFPEFHFQVGDNDALVLMATEHDCDGEEAVVRNLSSSQTTMSSQRVPIRCGLCKQQGHNRRTCSRQHGFVSAET